MAQRQGSYPPPPSASPVLGLEVAGGGRIFATAGSDDKCVACLRLGADAAINYRTQDCAEQVKALTGDKGVNVILDMVGGLSMGRNIRCLGMDGRLVMIAFLQGSTVQD